MSERFRAVDRDTACLLPLSERDWLPEQYSARFVVEAASKLDLHGLEMAYASQEYVDLLRDQGFRIVMSAKGDPGDNKFVESFFKTLRAE